MFPCRSNECCERTANTIHDKFSNCFCESMGIVPGMVEGYGIDMKDRLIYTCVCYYSAHDRLTMCCLIDYRFSPFFVFLGHTTPLTPSIMMMIMM